MYVTIPNIRLSNAFQYFPFKISSVPEKIANHTPYAPNINQR